MMDTLIKLNSKVKQETHTHKNCSPFGAHVRDVQYG